MLVIIRGILCYLLLIFSVNCTAEEISQVMTESSNAESSFSISGHITEGTCSLSTDTQEQTFTLPMQGRSQLDALAVGDMLAANSTFSLIVDKCGSQADQLIFRFSPMTPIATTVAGFGNEQTQGSPVQGMQLRIFRQEDDVNVLTQDGKSVDLVYSINGGVAPLQTPRLFYTRYVRDNNSLNSGIFITTAIINVSYK